MYSFKIADKDTWKNKKKTIGNGDKLRLVAIQESRRTIRKKKTQYIYARENSKEIYYNNSQSNIVFVPIARTIPDMEKFYSLFTNVKKTAEQKAYLERNGYQLLGPSF